MIVLDGTGINLQIVLGGSVTTNQLDCFTSWRDITTTAYTPGKTGVNTNNTTDVNIVPAPGASTQRVVDLVNIYNNDTAPATVTIKIDVGAGVEYILWKGVLAVGQTLSYIEGSGWSVSNLGLGYALPVGFSTNNPADASTIYFSSKPVTPAIVALQNKIYIQKAGTIKIADIFTYAVTAGSNEAWSFYIRVNDTTDHLIQTLSVSANERNFLNTSLSIALAVGDFIEIKAVCPAWGTNPLAVTCGGYIYIE